MTRRDGLAIVLLAITVWSSWSWLVSRPSPGSWSAASGPVSVPRGADRLLGLNPRQDDLGGLSAMAWADVKPTADAALADAFVRDRILAETADRPGAALAYLRALLSLGAGRPAEALTEFARAPADEIPVALLYAPWRVAGELRPGVANPYAGRLAAAARAGELDPLIAARVLSAEGDLKPALQLYLRSDPAAWTGHDLRLFGLMLAHDGRRGEAAAILSAAYRGGRVPERLKPQVLATLAAAARTDRAVPPSVAALVRADEGAKRVFVAAVERQLSARVRFLKGEDAPLIADYAATGADEASDEIVLLLTLSAARAKDAAAFDRWSGELARRFPQPEVTQWIHTLNLARS